MNSLEVKKKLVEYLNKKGIDASIEEYESLIWIYKTCFSTFKISLSFDKKDYDDDFYTIKYYISNYNIDGIKKRRTRTNTNNFQYNVYINLINIKSALDLIANAEKIKIDSVNRYCSELSSYYKKLHDKVNVSTTEYPDKINITVTTHDKNISTYYTIILKDNKYYLFHKIEIFNKDRNTENLLEIQLPENQDI